MDIFILQKFPMPLCNLSFLLRRSVRLGQRHSFLIQSITYVLHVTLDKFIFFRVLCERSHTTYNPFYWTSFFQHFWDSSMSLWVSVFHSCLLMYSILLYRYTICLWTFFLIFSYYTVIIIGKSFEWHIICFILSTHTMTGIIHSIYV